MLATIARLCSAASFFDANETADLLSRTEELRIVRETPDFTVYEGHDEIGSMTLIVGSVTGGSARIYTPA